MNVLQRILENLHTVVILLDGKLRINYINPAGEHLFAHSARHLTGTPLSAVIDDVRLIEMLGHAHRSGHPFTERELTLSLPRNDSPTVDLTAIPISEPGAPTALLVEMNQIDRHLRINREEALLAQSHASRALVRGLAHEIKNPLGGLRGAAQLLERELDDPELREYTGIIISEADRMQSLMNRMLGPNSRPNKVPLNIHQVLERVHRLVAAELHSGIRIVCDYDPSVPELEGDRDMLIQAILNLVRNAAQALGESGTITLRTRTLRQFTIGPTRYKLVARVDVQDDGPGIPEEMIENIFLPMVTGRPDGTGLGLPLAQSLINLHDGLIECERKGDLTLFTVLLPLALNRPAESPKPRR